MTTRQPEYEPRSDRQLIDTRVEVAEFATAMEEKLRKNDHKTGWHDQPIEAHIKLLRIEMMELDVALDHLGDEAAAKECIDVANFALIIWDKLLARIKERTTLRSSAGMLNVSERLRGKQEPLTDWPPRTPVVGD